MFYGPVSSSNGFILSKLYALIVVKKQPPEAFFKKAVLKNFAIFTGKHLCQSLFLNKVAGLRPVTLLKRVTNTGVFPVNIAKFLRDYFTEHLRTTASVC